MRATGSPRGLGLNELIDRERVRLELDGSNVVPVWQIGWHSPGSDFSGELREQACLLSQGPVEAMLMEAADRLDRAELDTLHRVLTNEDRISLSCAIEGYREDCISEEHEEQRLLEDIWQRVSRDYDQEPES